MATAAGLPTKRVKEVPSVGWAGRPTTTECPRCGGFMVIEPCFDFRVQRCVQCGNLVDPVILQNRQHGPAAGRKTVKSDSRKKAA
jgi:ribosomal protein L37E